MPLDPNIILNAQAPPPPNPIAIMGQIAQAGEAVQNNKLLQQKVGTNQAVSDATKASIDPQSGQVDTNKLMGILSKDPRAQADLPNIMGQILTNQQQQFSTAQQHLSNMSGRLSTLLKTAPGSLSQKDVLESMGQMLSEGLINPKEFATEAENLPADEGGIRQFLTQHLNRTLESQQRLNAMLGSPTTTETGAGTQYGTFGPETGYHPGPTVTRGLSPEGATTSRIYLDTCPVVHILNG